jgi:hypothetical protein
MRDKIKYRRLPKLNFIGFMLFLLKAVLALNKIDLQIAHVHGVYLTGLCGFFSDYSPSFRKRASRLI